MSFFVLRLDILIIKGLCKVATIEEIKNLHSEFKNLTDEAHKLENKIFDNLKKLDLKKDCLQV